MKSNGPAPDDPKDHGAELRHETETRCILLCSSSSTPAPQRTAPARNLKAVEHDRSWRKDFCLPTIELEAVTNNKLLGFIVDFGGRAVTYKLLELGRSKILPWREVCDRDSQASNQEVIWFPAIRTRVQRM